MLVVPCDIKKKFILQKIGGWGGRNHDKHNGMPSSHIGVYSDAMYMTFNCIAIGRQWCI